MKKQPFPLLLTFGLLGLIGAALFPPGHVTASGIAPPAYGTIQNAGAALTQRPTLNFINGGCADNAGQNRTDCPSPGSFFSQTNSVTDAVQTTETTLVGTGTGSTALPANTYAVGAVVIFEISGVYTTTASPGTLTIKLKNTGGASGTVNLGNTGAITPLASVTNGVWKLHAVITCRTTGTTGTLIVNTTLEMDPSSLSALTPANASIANSSTVTVDTTAAQTFDFTAAWSAASQSITSTNCVFYQPGASGSSSAGTLQIAGYYVKDSNTGLFYVGSPLNQATLPTAGSFSWVNQNLATETSQGNALS